MAHHIGDFEVSPTWAAICNELCSRVAQLFPRPLHRRRPCCRSRRASTPRTCIPELEKCVEQYGFVGINLNPDPSGGHWTSPPLTDRHWYPLYEKMVELRHAGDDPRQHQLQRLLPHHRRALPQRRHHRLHAVPDQGDLFKDFPTLRFLIPHGGGAVPYHWGRYRGLAQELKKPLLHGPPAEQRLLRHLRLPPAGHRPADQGDPGRQHPVRLRDDRRGARHRPRDRPLLRRHQALHRGQRRMLSADAAASRSTKATPAACSRGWMRR